MTRRTPHSSRAREESPSSTQPSAAPLRVRGFRFAGIAAGIKKKAGAPDLALIVADAPAVAAGVFTTNLVQAAPVTIAKDRVKRGTARAVLVNAGCANACTGKPGIAAAKRATKAVAAALGISDVDVLPASTGVIGALLPDAKIANATPALVASLSEDGIDAFSRAIMTTDRYPKVAHAQLRVGRDVVNVVGVAKGAGMIHPNMATTLGFVVTDARVSATALRTILRDAVDATFNCISVDGDTSTNDTIFALASCQGPAVPAQQLGVAVTQVLRALGESIVADGEGAEHKVTFVVEGLKTARAAKTIAHVIATSPLVKTALFGKDPNWGRILAAAGRAGVPFDPDAAEIRIGDVLIVRKGLALGSEAERRAHEVMQTSAYTVRVKLGKGSGRAEYVTCDLGHEYVKLNADYRS